MVVNTETPTDEVLVRIPGEAKFILSYRNKIGGGVEMMGSEIKRLCDGEVSWVL